MRPSPVPLRLSCSVPHPFSSFFTCFVPCSSSASPARRADLRSERAPRTRTIDRRRRRRPPGSFPRARAPRIRPDPCSASPRSPLRSRTTRCSSPTPRPRRRAAHPSSASVSTPLPTTAAAAVAVAARVRVCSVPRSSSASPARRADLSAKRAPRTRSIDRCRRRQPPGVLSEGARASVSVPLPTAAAAAVAVAARVRVLATHRLVHL